MVISRETLSQRNGKLALLLLCLLPCNGLFLMAPIQLGSSSLVSVSTQAQIEQSLDVPPKVLILVSTAPKFFGRVREIRETWGGRIDDKHENIRLVFISNTGVDDSGNMVLSNCSVNACVNTCKMADLTIYAGAFLKENPEFEWVFYGDDDVYLMPDNLQRVISSLPPSAAEEYAAWGIPGCGGEKCGGFCGGGGFFTNRRTIEMVRNDTSPSEMRNIFESFCEDCGGFGDITLSRFFTHNVSNPVALKRYPIGTQFVWEKPMEQIESDMADRSKLVWLLHYPSRGRMYQLYDMDKRYKTNQEYPTSVYRGFGEN